MFLHCFCYVNTSKKSDMLTIVVTSSKSSIELHVSYFKGNSLSKLLQRQWLKTRRSKKYQNISESKVISRGWLSYFVGDQNIAKIIFGIR